jgi:hypothetical protein
MKKHAALSLAVMVIAAACSDMTTAPTPITDGGPRATVTVIGNPDNLQVCPNTGTGDPSWTKIDRATGSGSGGFGSFDYAGRDLNYSINAGWVLQFCIKYGNNVTIYEIEGADAGSLGPLSNDISHVSWRIMEFVMDEDLEVVKDASGTYQRDIEWTLDKKVNGVDHLELSGTPGAVFDVEWQVAATKTIGDPYGFRVEGTITIYNPNTSPKSFGVSDVLNDGTVADVTCPTYTVPPKTGSTPGMVQCTYVALPPDASATLNTATVVPDDPEIGANPATAAVSFAAVYNGYQEGTLTDDRFPEFSELLSASANRTFPERFTCPENVSEYDENGICLKVFVNTATLTFDMNASLQDSARVTLTCQGLYGCTPGFWKQPHHFGHWTPTGYAPTQKLGGPGGVFAGANFANSGIRDATLVQALDFGGGGGVAGAQQILFRAAVASLLNLGHPDVNYAIPGTPRSRRPARWSRWW